jgi:hypothetical protein
VFIVLELVRKVEQFTGQKNADRHS